MEGNEGGEDKEIAEEINHTQEIPENKDRKMNGAKRRDTSTSGKKDVIKEKKIFVEGKVKEKV